MIGHEASTLATEYGPQWMNMPNFASLYQAVLSASDSFVAGGEAAFAAFVADDRPSAELPAARQRRKLNLVA
jgi:hypothetical protein